MKLKSSSSPLIPCTYLITIALLIFYNGSARALASSSSHKGTILVTGGAGYIGSHTCLELLMDGDRRVVVVDTLDNSSEESLRRVRKLTECAEERLVFRNCDIRSEDGLERGMCVMNLF